MHLSANWQFLLMNQILRGTFFMQPRLAIGMRDQVQQILTGQISDVQDRTPYSISLSRPTGQIQAATDDHASSIYDQAEEGSIAVFSIAGTMLKYGTLCDYGTAEIAGFMLEAIYHKNISGIVVDMDTGGGSVSAIAPILQVRKEARRLNKPFVASFDMCCSAGVYAISDADLIVANNNVSAEYGSIGVMMSFVDVIPHYEKEGFKFHSIYADQSDHKNQEFELALEGKYEGIRQNMLNPLALQFQDHVRKSRAGKLDESAKGILNGKVYFAEEAKKYGLIDEIGDLSLAIERAHQLAQSRKFLSQS